MNDSPMKNLTPGPSLDRKEHDFREGEKTAQQPYRLFELITAVLIAATLLSAAYVLISPRPLVVLLGVLWALGIEIGAWALQQRGAQKAASILLIAGLWLVYSAALFTADIRGAIPWIALLVLVWVSGLLLGYRAAFWMAAANALLGLFYQMPSDPVLAGRPALPFSPTGVWFAFTLSFFAAAGLSMAVSRHFAALQHSAEAAAQSAETLRRELEAAQSGMQAQIEIETGQLQTQVRYLNAVVAISREVEALQDPLRMAETVVNRLAEEFDLYYAGLFWLDAAGEWAVLQAGTGEAGQRMLARGHRIRVGSGMVGWSIANGQPRVALDVGRDAVRLATAELPETRTESAIPLRVRGRVLGAISLQSRQPQAFDEMELDAFQSLADQTAVAFENARRLEELRRALEEASRQQDQAGRRAWREFLQSAPAHSVRYASGRLVEAAGGGSEGSEALSTARRQALETGKPVQVTAAEGSAPRAALLLPIPVRGAFAGVLTLAKEAAPEGKSGVGSEAIGWQEDEVSLLETIVAQLGAALDTARLYEDTQRLAYREQLAGEVTDRIRQTLDIQMVLRTAAEEIQRSLNLPDIAISLALPEAQSPGERESALLPTAPNGHGPEAHERGPRLENNADGN